MYKYTIYSKEEAPQYINTPCRKAVYCDDYESACSINYYGSAVWAYGFSKTF